MPTAHMLETSLADLSCTLLGTDIYPFTSFLGQLPPATSTTYIHHRHKIWLYLPPSSSGADIVHGTLQIHVRRRFQTRNLFPIQKRISHRGAITAQLGQSLTPDSVLLVIRPACTEVFLASSSSSSHLWIECLSGTAALLIARLLLVLLCQRMTESHRIILEGRNSDSLVSFPRIAPGVL